MNNADLSKEPMINGGVLIGLLDCIKARFEGEAFLEELISALPPESEKVFRTKIIAVAYYPYTVFTDCLRAVDKIKGSGNFEKCRELGKDRGADVIRAFIQKAGEDLKLEEVLRLGDLIWKYNHSNSGYIKIEDASPQHGVLRIYDFPQMDPAHCTYMEGFLTQALTEAGAVWIQEAREVKCASKGDPYHEFTGQWRLSKP